MSRIGLATWLRCRPHQHEGFVCIDRFRLFFFGASVELSKENTRTLPYVGYIKYRCVWKKMAPFLGEFSAAIGYSCYSSLSFSGKKSILRRLLSEYIRARHFLL